LSLETAAKREAPEENSNTPFKKFIDNDYRLIEDDIEGQKRYIKNLESELKAARSSLRLKEKRLKAIQKKWSPENREKLLKKIQKEWSKSK
jgi:hypothetical protein